MKFTFKIQEYQTQAVNALVKCFEGQQYADKVLYLRDKGILPKVPKTEVQGQLFEDPKTEEQVLQSYKLKFINPFNNQLIDIEIEPDEKINKVLHFLENKQNH